jgi:error-prone DNA polymerase
VIEVAIVRPGPIAGDMVHPYLRRKSGVEPVTYPPRSNGEPNELADVLRKTLGVPLFQEQAMRIAIVAAGFSPEDADRLRRAMATFKQDGKVAEFAQRFIGGMVARGYAAEFAERCFRQIEGFGSYGFPESHAAAFAQLVYISAWIKCHHPAVFAAALLNSQPMGFYAPAQIVRDAREHGVAVRAADVLASAWDCTLEDAPGGLALRLGLRLVQGLAEDAAARIVTARAAMPDAARGVDADAATARGADATGAPARLAGLVQRAGLDRGAVERLAAADAFRGLGLGRREALWAAAAIEAPAPLLGPAVEPAVQLPRATAGEQTVLDYTSTGLSLRHHPMQLLRPQLAALGLADTRRLAAATRGAWLKLAGLVLVRQRPGSAQGVVFFTIEDEWGVANLVLYPDIARQFRAAVVAARLVLAEGRVERVAAAVPIIHLLVRRLTDRSDLLAGLHAMEDGAGGKGPWRKALARADEVERPDLRGDKRAAPGQGFPRSRDFH